MNIVDKVNTAYLEGRLAHFLGLNINQNPYTYHISLYVAWNSGWEQQQSGSPDFILQGAL